MTRVIGLALRRTTPARVTEEMTAGTHKTTTPARLAAWRLWRLIRTTLRPEYQPAPKVRVAAHVTAADERPAGAPRARRQGLALDDVHARSRQRTAERLAAAKAHVAAEDAARTAQLTRWGIHVPRLQEPEHVHRQQTAHLLGPGETPQDTGVPGDRPDTYAAALQKARAERRARARRALGLPDQAAAPTDQDDC